MIPDGGAVVRTTKQGGFLIYCICHDLERHYFLKKKNDDENANHLCMSSSRRRIDIVWTSACLSSIRVLVPSTTVIITADATSVCLFSALLGCLLLEQPDQEVETYSYGIMIKGSQWSAKMERSSNGGATATGINDRMGRRGLGDWELTTRWTSVPLGLCVVRFRFVLNRTGLN